MQGNQSDDKRERRLGYLKMMNYSMEVNEEKVEARVHTNGLTHADFDYRTGKPEPWNLMKFVGSARFYAHHWPLDETGRVFRDYAELTDDRLTFLVTCVMDIQREMYELPQGPLDVVIQGGYIGSSSLNSITTVLTSAGVELMSNTNQIVSVDKSTRRPLPLPDWWKQKYAESGKMHNPLKLNKIEKPENIPFYDCKVARSDLDGNNHTNWSVYVKRSFDAMYHFSKTGYLSALPNFDQFCLQRMELLYTGESVDDDLWHVYIWEDKTENFTVIVHIQKGDSFLFQGRFKFFDN